MRKTMDATEMRQFVEALEKQGLTPNLARLVEKDGDLAKELVGRIKDEKDLRDAIRNGGAEICDGYDPGY